VRFCYAEFATGEGTAPAYPQENVELYRTVCTDVRFVPGVDHAGSIMTKTGAVVVADLITDALA
jgi:hypothetical protein